MQNITQAVLAQDTSGGSRNKKGNFAIQRLSATNEEWRTLVGLTFEKLADAESCLARLRRGRSASTLRIAPLPHFAEVRHE